MRRQKVCPRQVEIRKPRTGRGLGTSMGLDLSQYASDGPCNDAAIPNLIPVWRMLIGFGSRRPAQSTTARKYRIDPILLYYHFEYVRELSSIS
jgi:hypothetical protein